MLSGYLVTQVLLRDLDPGTGPGGRIAYGRFYARRIRRLLPASVVTIVATAAVYGAIAPRTALDAAADSMQAALLYVANWYFIAQSADYFTPDGPSPVLHFWSLAVEEQFYVVWPLLLAGLWRLAGRRGADAHGRRRVVAGLAGLAALASFAGMLALRTSAPSRAYFGTDTRAYQLLIGAALALLPGIVTRARGHRAAIAAAPLGLVGIVAISTSLIDQGPFVRGAVAAASAWLLIVGVEADPAAPVARGLSLRPIAYLGTISYATYLWHWPVIVVVQELDITTSATTLALLTALVATGIAALSSELLELPLRRSPSLERHRRVVIAGGLAVSVVAAVVVVPPLLDLDRNRVDAPGTAPGAAPVGAPVPATFDFASTYDEGFGDAVECHDGPASDCTVVDGDGTHVLLVGDSNAMMYVPALTELARAEGLRFSASASAGCVWQVGFVHLQEAIQQRCRALRADTYDRLLRELDPDVILLVNGRILAGRGPSSAAEPGPTLEAATERSLDLLEATGAELVIVPPLPLARGPNPLDCLADAATVDECALELVPGVSWLDDLLTARAAASDQIHLVDLTSGLCPRSPRCDAMSGDVPVFWNVGHITRAYSRTLAVPIGKELAALGLIPPLTSTDT